MLGQERVELGLEGSEQLSHQGPNIVLPTDGRLRQRVQLRALPTGHGTRVTTGVCMWEGGGQVRSGLVRPGWIELDQVALGQLELIGWVGMSGDWSSLVSSGKLRPAQVRQVKSG